MTGGSSLPASFQTTLSNFAALGVDVALTETDVTNADVTQYTNLTVAKFGAACDSKAGLSKCAITSGTLKFS